MRRMTVTEYIRNNILILDGAMGTQLHHNGLKPGELPEKWNTEHPDIITGIHRDYFDAGANLVCTNTFGANSLKFSPEELDAIVSAAVANAREAARRSKGAQEISPGFAPAPSRITIFMSAVRPLVIFQIM